MYMDIDKSGEKVTQFFLHYFLLSNKKTPCVEKYKNHPCIGTDAYPRQVKNQ
jgi:hypothetical protein